MDRHRLGEPTRRRRPRRTVGDDLGEPLPESPLGVETVVVVGHRDDLRVGERIGQHRPGPGRDRLHHGDAEVLAFGRRHDDVGTIEKRLVIGPIEEPTRHHPISKPVEQRIDDGSFAAFVITDDGEVKIDPALEESPDAPMATVVHRAEADALGDPNRVKVVLDRAGFALYFSRAPIPHARERSDDHPIWQHIGIYAYRREFLTRYVALSPTPLEQAERLEQLRALEHSFRIRAAVVEVWHSVPVDVPDDVARVEPLLEARARS